MIVVPHVTLSPQVLSHGARVANLAAARARGGIYTARPWQVMMVRLVSDLIMRVLSPRRAVRQRARQRTSSRTSR